MPGLTDLSNELYFEILQYLPPPDLGSFFCVNKTLYAVTAIHRGRHQDLKRRFSTSLNTKRPGSTARLIKNILADPSIALYVQHFTIDGCREMYDPDVGEIHHDNMAYVEYTASDVRQIELAMRDLKYLSVDGIETWTSCLKNGQEKVLIMLAPTLFPNLTSVEIRASDDFEYQTSDHISSFIEKMIPNHMYEKRAGPLFAKLVSVTIGASAGYFSHVSLMEAFAMLPSVRVINAERIYGESGRLHMIDVPRIGSKVTDLNLSHGDVPPQRLMILLQRFERLQSFAYLAECDPQHNFDPFSIITVLSACAQDTLRELHIRAEPAIRNYMGSLRKFRVLEYLNTDTDLLFGPSAKQKFSTSLPSSIRVVKLHGWHYPFYYVRVLSTSLTDSRNDFPNLQRIELLGVRVSERNSAPHVATLQDLCAMHNISLRIVESRHVWFPVFTRLRGHYAQRQAKKALSQVEDL